ncbi:2-C-methyl-D-erythritol 4-phosphate cytidylyltransferase [Guggenheimella bovis]
MSIVALIMASGSSRRMGENKLLLPYKEHTVIEETVSIFNNAKEIKKIVLVTSDREIRKKFEGMDKVKAIVPGGVERMDSVMNGLSILNDDDYVLIHDGARPFLSKEALDRALQEAREGNSFLLAVPATDTVKVVKDSVVLDTPPRETIYLAQTPQGFPVKVLKRAIELREPGILYTDDASIVERIQPVKVVLGDFENVKLTLPKDKERLCTE